MTRPFLTDVDTFIVSAGERTKLCWSTKDFIQVETTIQFCAKAEIVGFGGSNRSHVSRDLIGNACRGMHWGLPVGLFMIYFGFALKPKPNQTPQFCWNIIQSELICFLKLNRNR